VLDDLSDETADHDHRRHAVDAGGRLAKVRVASSSPVVRSKKTPGLARGFMRLPGWQARPPSSDVLTQRVENAPDVHYDLHRSGDREGGTLVEPSKGRAGTQIWHRLQPAEVPRARSRPSNNWHRVRQRIDSG
jgi:hypothetical protein